MVDSVPILPAISPPRVARAKVTEKDPHHQQPEQQHHEKNKDDEDVHDEVIINGIEEPDKKPKPHSPLHNIDIEA